MIDFSTRSKLHSFYFSYQEPKVAFEDIDSSELYPCVMFYSSNPGEKVRFCCCC